MIGSEDVSSESSLSPEELYKLRMLTVVSMTTQSKALTYQALMTEIGIGTVRELEKVLLDCIYAKLIRGTLDQRRGVFLVQGAVSRDAGVENLAVIPAELEAWIEKARQVEAELKTQIDFVRDRREHRSVEERNFVERLKSLKMKAETDS